jgi:DNA-directed RNA polymerase I, II, and III subunit RPABC2
MSNVMTTFEFTRIMGQRMLQLSRNAPPVVDVGGETDITKIAEMEMRARKIPIVVRRRRPDGTHEDWRACELRLPGDFRVLT